MVSDDEGSSVIPAGVWKIDPVHSTISFSVKSMGIVTFRGFFTDFEGAIEFDGRGGGKAYGTIRAASIETRNESRDQHLRSAEFLDVDTDPEIRFETKAIAPDNGGRTGKVVGEVTIKGIIREVALDAEIIGPVKDPWGNERIGIEASARVDRRDFGVNYDQVIPGGELMVGNQIGLEVHLSAVKEP